MPRFVASRGGYVGWWVAGAVGMVAFSRVAFFNPVLGIFVEPLEQEFGWSRTEIAGALSIGTLVGGIGAPFIGHYIDRWGARWFMVGGMIATGVLLLLLALVESLWQFYILFGAGRAVVTAILDIAIVVTIANWFIRQRGRATGLMMAGTRLAMALMPLIVLLFLTVADWRAAFAALGVMVLVVAVLPPYLLVRRRPEDMGLAPDGDRPVPGHARGARRHGPRLDGAPGPAHPRLLAAALRHQPDVLRRRRHQHLPGLPPAGQRPLAGDRDHGDHRLGHHGHRRRPAGWRTA